MPDMRRLRFVFLLQSFAGLQVSTPMPSNNIAELADANRAGPMNANVAPGIGATAILGRTLHLSCALRAWFLRTTECASRYEKSLFCP